MFGHSDPQYAFLKEMKENATFILGDSLNKFVDEQKRIMQTIFGPSENIIKMLEIFKKPAIEFQRLIEDIQKSNRELPSGVYFAIFRTTEAGVSRKLIILR